MNQYTLISVRKYLQFKTHINPTILCKLFLFYFTRQYKYKSFFRWLSYNLIQHLKISDLVEYSI